MCPSSFLSAFWCRIERSAVRPFMPRQQNQRGGQLMDRVRHQAEHRALEQANRVPWKRLAAAADEYTDWQVFSLWLRAVMEVSRSVPTIVADEIESRAPQLLARIRSDVEAPGTNGRGAGERIWQDVSQWAEVNVFITARTEGWLEAVRYFSSMSLRAMKAWSLLGADQRTVARCDAETVSDVCPMAV